VVVGCLIITVHLPDSRSLKDKRRIVQSILTRLRQKMQVAAAEVDEQSAWGTAVLGFACVSNTETHARKIMTSIVDWVAEQWDVDVRDAHIEIFS
jgi:hypothetical protein